MAIIFDSKAKTISLHTAHSTWQMAISRYNYLLHLYYGARIDCDMSYLLEYSDRAFAGNPADAKDDRTFSLDVLPQEYPSYGTGDFRIFSLNVRTADGVYGCDLRYVSHNIKKGKYTIPGLPSVRADDSEAETLEIILEDACLPLRVILRYGVLENLDVITRCAEIVNTGDAKIFVTKANSACLDLLSGDYDLIHFPGRHGNPRPSKIRPLLKRSFLGMILPGFLLFFTGRATVISVTKITPPSLYGAAGMKATVEKICSKSPENSASWIHRVLFTMKVSSMLYSRKEAK